MADCPICHRNDAEGGRIPSRDAYGFECRRCGHFKISGTAAIVAKGLAEDLRPHISCFLRERTVRKLEPIMLLTAAPGKEDPSEPATSLADAAAGFPLPVQERLDRTLQNLAAVGPRPGATLSLDGEVDAPLTYAEDARVMKFVLLQLEALGFIGLQSTKDGGLVTLSVQGWNRVADLERGVRPAGTGQAFVALWFGNPDRVECEAGLAEGVRGAGYTPWIADRVDYIDKVDERIIAEIRKSRFLVADLTGHRPNVYYEAGFANGLGIPPIFTCHRDHVGDAHFDTRQYNMILWTNRDELATALKHRIVAVFGLPGERKPAP
jgi:hypothetical protein